MSFNWKIQSSQWFVDQHYNMMLQQNLPWMPKDANGQADAIGRTLIAIYTYGDKRFIRGVENCWERVERKGWLKRLLFGKYYYQGYRYPDRGSKYDYRGLSRDHTIYSILSFKYSNYYSDKKLKEFVTHINWKISDFAKFTPNMWCWVRAVAGSKFWRWMYYNVEIPTMIITKWWTKLVYKIAPFEEECHQDEWVWIANDMKPEKLDKWASRLFPIYALHILAWQIFLLPDSRRKRKLQKICLGIAPKHNYVIKMLLGDKTVSKRNVYSYKSMLGGRWTGILNPFINDRYMKINEDESVLDYNVMDVDYVRKLYDELIEKN